MNAPGGATAAGVFAFIWLAGCAGAPGTSASDVRKTARVQEEYILYSSTTWSGDILITRPIIVTKAATLTLRPGTRVFFDVPTPTKDTDREPWILVLGGLSSLGTPEQPVQFSSVELAHNDLDDMIQVRDGKEVHLRYSIFERGPWALHLHGTPVEVSHCSFLGNFGGIRFQAGAVTIRSSRFEDNQIGVRCLQGDPIFEGNTFSKNLTGIFFREGIRGAQVRRNNFDNIEYDIKMGEGQTTDVVAAENYWKAAKEGKLDARIFDASDSQGVGRLIVDQPLAVPWNSVSGGR